MAHKNFDPTYVFHHHHATPEKIAQYNAIHAAAQRLRGGHSGQHADVHGPGHRVAAPPGDRDDGQRGDCAGREADEVAPRIRHIVAACRPAALG